MKLSRWALVFLIVATVTSSFGVVAWWWIQWPKHMLATFIALVAAGDFDGANDLLDPRYHFDVAGDGEVILTAAHRTVMPVETWQKVFDATPFTCEPRSAADILQGRLKAKVGDACIVRIASQGIVIDYDGLSTVELRVRSFSLENRNATDVAETLVKIFGSDSSNFSVTASEADTVSVRGDIQTMEAVEHIIGRLDRGTAASP